MSNEMTQKFLKQALQGKTLKEVIIAYNEFDDKYTVATKEPVRKRLIAISKNYKSHYYDAEYNKLISNASQDVLEMLYNKFAEIYNNSLKAEGLYSNLHFLNTEQERQAYIAKYKKEGNDIDAKTQNGDTALCIAAKHGDPETAKALIMAGANVNHQNNKGLTPLMLATQNKYLETMKILARAEEIQKWKDLGIHIKGQISR